MSVRIDHPVIPRFIRYSVEPALVAALHSARVNADGSDPSRIVWALHWLDVARILLDEGAINVETT